MEYEIRVMLFDVGHANIFIREPKAAGISLETYIEQLPFRIHEVHISDNNSGRRDEHLPPGGDPSIMPRSPPL